MAISIRTENPNILTEAPSRTPTASSSNNEPALFGNNSVPQNNTSNTNLNTDNSTQNVTKRSKTELYNTLQNISSKYGIKPAEIKEIFEKVSGKTEAELLNTDETEINNILKIINSGIDLLKSQKKEINAKSIIEISKNLKIRLDNCWTLNNSVQDIKNNSRQESFADKLKRFYPKQFGEGYKNRTGKDFDFSDPANYEIIKTYTAKYMENQYKTNKIGIKDMAKMLANSKNDAERDLFDSILKDINSNYRANFISSWLYSYDDDNNRAHAADYVMDNVIEITDGTPPTDTQKITFAARKSQNSQEEIVRTDKKFYDAANEYFRKNNIEEIINKVKNQGIEALNNDEQDLYQKWQQYQAIMSGGISGTIANQNVDRDFVTSHLRDYVNPQIYGYGEDSYREIMSDVQKFYEEHSGEFNLDEESFSNLMNEVTKGNYSIITSNDDAPLNPPSGSESVEAAQSSTSGELTEAAGEQYPPHQTYEPVHEITATNTNEIKGTDEQKNIKTNGETFIKNKDKRTVVSYLLSGFSNLVDGLNSSITWVVDKSVELVKRSNIKDFYFNNTESNETKLAIVEDMSLNEIRKIDGNTTYLSDRIKEIQKEKEERFGKYNPIEMGLA